MDESVYEQKLRRKSDRARMMMGRRITTAILRWVNKKGSDDVYRQRIKKR